VQIRDQQIFPTPSPLVLRFESEFIRCQLLELLAFCRTRFERTSLICTEDFAVIDQRTLQDKTLLFARWEQYTPEDDAILRLVWGDSKPEDEAWLKDSFMTREDAALFRKAEGTMTMADEVALRKFRDETIQENDSAIAKIQKAQSEALGNKEILSDGILPDQQFLEQLELATPSTVPQNPPPEVFSPTRLSSSAAAGLIAFEGEGIPEAGQTGPKHEKTGPKHEQPGPKHEQPGPKREQETVPRVEIIEGLRTIRIPMKSAMRDIGLIYRRSITDLLKISSLFDKNGVLKY
jgi:hypothetical protein